MPEKLPADDQRLWQTYARFRSIGPVIPLEMPGGVQVWAATSHAAVREVLQGDNRLWAKHLSKWKAFADGHVPADWVYMPFVRNEHMLFQDGAEHARLRRLVSKAFTPGRVTELEPFVEKVVDDLLNRMGAETDLVPALAEQLPMRVIGELFGVPDADLPAFRRWTKTLFSSTATPEEATTAGRDMLEYLHRLVELKRKGNDDDLTVALISAHDDEGRLTTTELVDMLHLMLVAGHETTMHLISNAALALLTHPEQRVTVLKEGRWPDAIEETLRLHSPVAGSLFRYAIQDVTIAGVTIPAGEAVYVCYNGAATDVTEYGEDATRFDINRTRKDHLAFGRGPHFCLGAPLARLEGRIAVSRLFERFPNITLAADPEDLPWTPSFLVNGPVSVPVSLSFESHLPRAEAIL